MSKTTITPPAPAARLLTPSRKDASSSAGSASASVSRFPAFLEALSKRRHFVVDQRSQFRAAFMVAGVVGLLLVLLNLSLYFSRAGALAALVSSAPELDRMLRAQNRLELALVLLGSLVFVAGVFVVTILETHKTAGAALVISRRLRDLAQGRLGARLRLRKDDNLREIEQSFNALADSLERGAREDVRTLEAMANTALDLSGPDEARRLAGRIREYAAKKIGNPADPPTD